jgi:predicted dithiol-disulfide oxidoreductase (DUF899 family)
MPQIASRKDWFAARVELLAAEKEFQRQRDTLAAKRRELPWVKVDKDYFFQTSTGDQSLSDLFGDHDQLIIQHFMMGPDWDSGCPSCSFWADGFNGTTAHLAARDAAFVCVSNTSLEKIAAYKTRMNWDFDWVSCMQTDFNTDYFASFTAEQVATKNTYYNFRENSFPSTEAPAISVFAKDDEGAVFHTYSTYARGLDNMNATYQYLDLLPKGRDEDGFDYPMAWLKRHDEYEGESK